MVIGTLGTWLHSPPVAASVTFTAQSTSEEADSSNLCPAPALSRVQSHSVSAGETLESIAAAYTLLPVTVIAMNPAIQSTPLVPGLTLRIPPFNGIEVNVPAGQTWQDLATTYRIRADILFEVNGCPAAVPTRIFVPGVNWLLATDAPATANASTEDPLTGYPLSTAASIVSNFGWQPHPERDELVFRSGITLQGDEGATVLAVGDGTVAFMGDDDDLGTLIVINHAAGFQTRYASITDPQVQTGDTIRAGQAIATAVTSAEAAAVLYFEVRTNSALGWVARDPGDYLPDLAVR